MPDQKEILDLLLLGDFSMQAQFVAGSNYTFFGVVSNGTTQAKVVYKPIKGEQPLWDFPVQTLAKREVAAFQLSEYLDWALIPPTVFRKKGLSFGPGSIQLYIEHDPAYHYFTFSDHDRSRLEKVALFDLISNNADRKASHVMFGEDGHLWCIDHGLCFNSEDKLRTVIWEFAGKVIDPSLAQKLRWLIGNSSSARKLLKGYLTGVEMDALMNRTAYLLECGVYPQPGNDRRMFPFPPI